MRYPFNFKTTVSGDINKVSDILILPCVQGVEKNGEGELLFKLRYVRDAVNGELVEYAKNGDRLYKADSYPELWYIERPLVEIE